MKLSEISQQLNSYMKANNLLQKDVEKQTGISQSQISRIKNGKFKTNSENVKILCKYAKIKIENAKSSRIEPQENSTLMEAIDYAWDRTNKNANVLAKIIRSLKGL